MTPVTLKEYFAAIEVKLLTPDITEISEIRGSRGFTLNCLSAQISVPIFNTGCGRTALADAKIAQAEYQGRCIPLEGLARISILIANTISDASSCSRHVGQLSGEQISGDMSLIKLRY